MKRFKITMFTAIMLIMNTCCIAANAENDNFSDYIPKEKPANLIIDAKAINTRNSAAISAVVTDDYAEYTMTNNQKQWNVFCGASIAAKLNSGSYLNLDYFKKSTTYVYSARVKNTGTDSEKIPYYGVAIRTKKDTSFDSSIGSNEYGKEGMAVLSADWVDFKATVTFPDDWDETVKSANYGQIIYQGLGYKSDNGSKLQVSKSVTDSLYIAEEEAYDILVDGDSDELASDNEIELSAEVVNQIGIEGTLSQAISWYAVDGGRDAVCEGFTFEENDGKITVAVDEDTAIGTYYIIAQSDTYDDFRKGYMINVVKPQIKDYVPKDKDEAEENAPYDICITPNDDISLKEDMSQELSVTIVDKNGNSEELLQNFEWYIINGERTERVEPLKLEVQNNTAIVSADIYSDSGEYYLVAESKDYQGFRKSVKISADIKDIRESVYELLKTQDKKEIEKNISNYMNALKISFEAESDEKVIAEIIYNERENLTIDELERFLEKAGIISCYAGDNDMYDSEGEFIYDLGLEKIDNQDVTLYSLFKNEMSKEGKIELQKALKKEYKSFDEFEKTFAAEVILKCIEYPKKSGIGVLEKILTEANAEFADINIDNYTDLDNKDSAAEYILKKKFTKSELEETIKNIKTLTKDKPNKRNNGGGSGGGASGGGSGTSIIIKTNTGNDTKKDDEKNKSESGASIFKDVLQEHWAYDDIYYLSRLNVISGVDDDYFKPDNTVTREQFVKMICLAFKYDIIDEASDFSDVTHGEWYEKYIVTATKNGIINGVSNTKFGLGMPVTREDMCTVIARVLSKDIADMGETEFSDDAAISEYAKSSVAYLYSIGVVNGFGDGSFKPKQECTRAQAAKIISAVLNSGGLK